MKEVIIAAPCRTAVGKMGGTLKAVPAEELARTVLEGTLARSGIDPAQIDEVILGHCRQSSDNPNVARIAALRGGIPEAVPAYTVMRQCASGMTAIHNGAMSIAEVVAGMEAGADIIKVFPGADKTEAYQSNKNVCASPEARMYSKPQLIIDCDDVKCSHGSSIGQIDQNALFYMQSRGIPEHEARLMLMQAFMNDVIAGVRLESLKNRLRHLVETHILGGSSSCQDCAGACPTTKKD